MMAAHEFGDRRTNGVTEHDRLDEDVIIVWGGNSFDGSTDLYVIRNGSVTGMKFRDEILVSVVRSLF